jgi:hypothetical protein
LVQGGGVYTRLRERGWGDPIPTRGQTLLYSIGKCILCGFQDPINLGRSIVSRDTDLEDCFEIQEFGSRDSYIFKVRVLTYGSIDSQVGPHVLGPATSRYRNHNFRFKGLQSSIFKVGVRWVFKVGSTHVLA